MARLERTLAEMRALLKQHASTLPSDVAGDLRTLIKVAEEQVEELREDLNEKDGEISGLEDRVRDATSGSASHAARELCEWSRGEDPRVVGKVLEAIRGGARFRPLRDLCVGAAYG